MMRKCESCGTMIRVKEHGAIPPASYDPLIDVAYENIKRWGGRDQDHQLIAKVGGMAHVEAMRSQVAL